MKTSLKTLLGLLLLTVVTAESASAKGISIYAPATPYTKEIKKWEYYFFSARVDRFNNARPHLQEKIKEKLGKGNLIAKGITLYDMNVRIGEAKFRLISKDQFEITVPGNHLYAKATQGVVGKWGDFAAEVNFDLRLHVGLKLPTQADPELKVAFATLSVPRLTAKSRNVVTGVAAAAGLMLNFFNTQVTGRDLIADAANKYLKLDITNEMNNRLGDINKELYLLKKVKMIPNIYLKGETLMIEFSAPQLTAEEHKLLKNRKRRWERIQKARQKQQPVDDLVVK